MGGSAMVNAKTMAVYARAVTAAAHARDPAVRAAFAAVPREHFLGGPPWQLFGDFGHPQRTDDPQALYRDVLVAIDERRGINNGEPQLWALIFDRLDVRPGARVLHVGAGTGYYTAILAELAGNSGTVTAVEVEADLAERAREALKGYRSVTVLPVDAARLVDLPYDRIVFSCGVTGLPTAWLDGMTDGVRIALPFTGADHAGIFLLLQRRQDRFQVTPLCGVSIYPAAGFRSDGEERLLDGVRRADPEALWRVKSLDRSASIPPADRIYGFGAHAMSAQPLPG